MTEDGEKKKKDLVITKYTGLPFNCDLYDRSPWKCAEGIFFLMERLFSENEIYRTEELSLAFFR